MNSKEDLNISYLEAFDKFKLCSDLNYENVKNSIELFNIHSIKSRNPIPKDLDVVGVVSGIEFEAKFKEDISLIQSKLEVKLGQVLNYMVKPSNLAVEYCVLKWPEEIYDQKIVDQTWFFLKKMDIKPFEFTISGIQMHIDGCIVLRGFSENMIIHRVRNRLKECVLNFPNKQSNWSHVPIGRILEPIDEKTKKNLTIFLDEINKDFKNLKTKINKIYLVHEKRWYMEKIDKLHTKFLN